MSVLILFLQWAQAYREAAGSFEDICPKHYQEFNTNNGYETYVILLTKECGLNICSQTFRSDGVQMFIFQYIWVSECWEQEVLCISLQTIKSIENV